MLYSSHGLQNNLMVVDSCFLPMAYTILYSRLSGLSPFAGEDDLETLQNVKQCDWEFDEDAFSNVSQEAKEFIRALLQKQPQYVDWMKSKFLR